MIISGLKFGIHVLYKQTRIKYNAKVDCQKEANKSNRKNMVLQNIKFSWGKCEILDYKCTFKKYLIQIKHRIKNTKTKRQMFILTLKYAKTFNTQLKTRFITRYDQF